VLPNLPDEEGEHMTECNVEEDSGDQDGSFHKIGKRKVNNSFYLNNVSAFDIKYDENGDDSFLAY
jgi:hypothetical protein